MKCRHESFSAHVNINRRVVDDNLQGIDGTLSVQCAQCKEWLLLERTNRDNVKYSNVLTFSGAKPDWSKMVLSNPVTTTSPNPNEYQ